MRFSLHDHPDGVETAAGNRVVYDVERNEAFFGAAKVGGHALVWELGVDDEGAIFSREIDLDPATTWIARCDRIDFPPGGIAYMHTHPGPGIRFLLHGELQIRTLGKVAIYGPGGIWFEQAGDPILAVASPTDETAFVRVLLLPAEWEGKRTIRYVDPADEEKPKLQRPTVFFDHALARRMVRPGGRILVDQLELHGADLAFGVPGESYLAVLDALHDSPIRYVVCRHEVGAANMADAYGKLTGRPGICMVTRGPGATHASGGIHTAFQDSTPLILLIGQVGRDMLEREAFQEIDYRRMFGPMAKWVAQIDEVERIPELIARAFHVATSGRPGPVVLALPEDMLVEEADVADAAPYEPTRTHPGEDDLERMRALLQGAARPLVIVGGRPWSAEAHDDLAAWCEAGGLRSPRRSAARTTWTTTRPSTRDTSRSARTRGSAPACGTPTCCSSSATGSARSRRPGTRSSTCRARSRR